AISNLLWPLIVLGGLIVFRGPLSRVIRSAEQRDFTIKLGGEEVSVGQLSRQQMDLMTDLHEQLATVRNQLAELEHAVHPDRVPAPVGAGPDGPPVADAAPEEAADEGPDAERPAPAKPDLPPGAGPAPWDRLDPVADESDEPGAEQIQPIEPGAVAPHALSANGKGDPPTGPLATVGLA